ncbi:hypothetical protein [Kallipyga massiliensis]|uniref:hypothetical protein n=1 Tax=Kallipyga massiliensis TaxID=1472764 RepID=UPI0004BA592A|nr:hypothetical protein [Kallipyga massiliensis]
MKENELPLILRLEKARNELRYALNQTAGKYELPGFLLDLIIEALLSEEKGQRIALMSEQISAADGKEEKEHGHREDLSQ